MKTKIKSVYYCEHCKKHGLSKSKMIYHESICFNNPENYRPCFNCQHLIKLETEIYGGADDYLTGEPLNDTVNYFYCHKKSIFLYTPKNEIKNNFHHTDIDGCNFENYPMPKDCEIYNQYISEMPKLFL